MNIHYVSRLKANFWQESIYSFTIFFTGQHRNLEIIDFSKETTFDLYLYHQCTLWLENRISTMSACLVAVQLIHVVELVD